MNYVILFGEFFSTVPKKHSGQFKRKIELARFNNIDNHLSRTTSKKTYSRQNPENLSHSLFQWTSLKNM